jgi:hypothetical protein
LEPVYPKERTEREREREREVGHQRDGSVRLTPVSEQVKRLQLMMMELIEKYNRKN